ncbi:GNAT family protein [Crossiella cryophila]
MVWLEVDERIVLRSLEEADLPALYGIVAAERSRLAGWLPWVDQVWSAEDLRRRPAAHTALVIEVDGRVAGSVTVMVSHADRVAALGYWLAADFCGAGVLTRCLRALLRSVFTGGGINRVEIRVAADNLASRRVAERLGLGHEGTLRRAAVLGGRVRDVEVYAALAGEWAAPPVCANGSPS